MTNLTTPSPMNLTPMSELDWDEDETTGVWIPHTTLFQLLDTIEKEWGKRQTPSCLIHGGSVTGRLLGAMGGGR